MRPLSAPDRIPRRRPLRHSLATRCLALLLAVCAAATLASAPAQAQDQQPPPPRGSGQAPVMQNVFFNVLWGSAVGALLGFAAAVESSTDKTNPTNAQSQTYQGATIGGLVGLGLGVWLVWGGITFDPNGSTLTRADTPASSDPVAYEPRDLMPAPGSPFGLSSVSTASSLPVTGATTAQPLFSFETARGQPGRIVGFRALVMDLRF